MWPDRIVELWQDTMRNQIDPLLLFSRELPFCSVRCRVPRRLAAQPGLRFRGTNEFENLFVTDQRLSSPIAADMREQAVLNRIPFGSARGKMRHSDCQSEFVRHSLQPILPSPAAIAIGIAAITFNQQFMLVGVMLSSNPQPPASDRPDSKLWCLVRSSHDDEPFVAGHIIDPEWDCYAYSVAGIVILQHIARCLPPRAASILEVPNQFAFLRINTDDRLAGFEKAAAHPGDIAHLSVTFRVLFFGQALAIDANRVIQFPQQTADGENANFETLASQLSFQRAQSLACPLDPGDWIASRSILQQLLQRFQDSRLFFSIVGRPAPVRRRRPAVARSARWTSERPRQMVFRLIPVISINRAMPPRPHWSASRPTKRRRFFSSRPATTRLIAWCSLATALYGCRWQVWQEH
jgi:hypothetical protein